MEKIKPKNKQNKDLLTVLFVLRDKGGCGYYRCIQPASFLKTRGLMNTIVDVKKTTHEHILKADLVVLQETGSINSVEIMNFAMANNKPVVIEVDDYLHGVSPNNHGGYGAWNPASLYIARFTQQMSRVDAVTVSTPQLAREYFAHNSKIYVLPNFLNQNKWSDHQTKKKDGYLRIGWAGGNAHRDDLQMIVKVINRIVFEHKDKVKFETMGMLKKELQDTFPNLEEFKDICPKCNYQGDSITWAGESLENYPMVLASHGWDIALAPVINNAFGNAKSDIKLKEYAAIGYPIVASAVTPYIEAKEDGCDVLLAKNFKEWYNYIKFLIDNPERRDEIVKNNKKWVAKKWIGDNIKLYADVYQQIIKSYSSKLNKQN